MGLDLTLAAVILIAGIRGWFKGFLLQAIGLGALASCVFLADPIRDFARPHAAEYLPGVRPELLERLLWWSAAVLSFLVVSGIGKGVVRAYRRRPYGEREPDRGDQGAGFLLGAAKGFVVASFVAAALLKHTPEYLKAGGYAEQQVRTSRGLVWAERYRPAERIWTSSPVQTIVQRVRTRGLWDESALSPGVEPTSAEPPAAVSTAVRPRTLEVPPPEVRRPRRLNPDAPDFLLRLDDELKQEGLHKSR